ncbi:MAG: hypothetical protein LBI10_04555 [Deltaproteobacteria bacterium]|nr:hypothetical protein [Deltaproteobacteria bacterium]
MPGLIIYNLFNIKTRFNIFLIIVIGISLAVNSNIVLLLCLLNVYNKSSLLLLILIEFIFIIYFLFIKKKIKESTFIYLNKFNYDNNNEISKNTNDRFLYIVKYCHLVIFILFAYVLVSPAGLAGLGEIFKFADAVFSWNRWAVDLATTNKPVNPMGYPQLLPAIFSIPYVLMEDVWVQFFSYAICLIFPSYMFLIILSIFEKFPISSFITAVVVFLWPVQKFVHYAGYADFPVSIMGFLATGALLWGYKENEITRIKCLFLSVIFLGATGAIKQAGLLLLIFFPFIVYEFSILSSLKRNLKVKIIIAVAFITIFFALPWYIYYQYLLKIGQATSNFQALTQGMHENRTYLERFLLSISRWPGIFILCILGIPGLFVRENRFISAFGITYIVIWMFFYSYDARNSYLAIPFLAFSVGLSLQKFILSHYNFVNNLNFNFLIYINKHKSKFLLLFLIIFIILMPIIIYKSDNIDNSLYKRQDRKVLSINFNDRDYKFISNLLVTDPNFIIITNDQFLKFTSRNLKNRLYYIEYNTSITMNIVNNYIDNTLINNPNKPVYLYFTDKLQNFLNDKKFIDSTIIFNGRGTLYKVNNK